MNKTTKNVILASTATLLCASAVAAGATYSLWSANHEVNNHIAAGSLEIELKKTSFIESKLQDDGTLIDETDNTEVNLIDDASKLFDVSEVFPMWSSTTTINVKNVGNVPVDYSVAFNFNSEDYTKNEDIALSEQLKVTLKGSDGEKIKDFMLDETDGEFEPLGTLYVNKDADFFVSVEFVNDDDINNDAMRGAVEFDLSVKAVQKTTLA